MATLEQTIFDARQRRSVEYEKNRTSIPDAPQEDSKALGFLPGTKGVSITPFTEDKSLARRSGEDLALLGQGVTVGIGQLAAGLTGFGTKEEDKFWSPAKPFETVKEIGGSTVQGFKDLVDPQFYKEHPLLAGANVILTAASIASYGLGFLVKAPIMSAIKGAMSVGVKNGVKSSIVESALRTGIKIGGKQITKGTLGHAVEIGIAKGNFQVVRETAISLLKKKGVVGESADAVANSLVKNLTESLARDQTRNKILSRIGHPLAATTTGIKEGIATLRSISFGADEASGVGIKFTSKVVGENPQAFLGMERWAEQQVIQDGLENTSKNRALKMTQWEAENPSFSILSPEQKAAHFVNYAEATQSGKLLSAYTDTAGVVVKAVDQNTVDAMVRTVKDAEEGADLIKMLKENGFEKELRFNEEGIVIGLAGQTSKEAVIAQVKNLSKTGSTIVFKTLSSKETALLKDIGDRGYRYGYAPKGKEIIFAEKVGADVVGGGTSPAAKAVKDGLTEEQYVKGQGTKYSAADRGLGTGKYGKSRLNPTERGSWSSEDIASGKSPIQTNVSIESLRLSNQDISFFSDFERANKILGTEGSFVDGYTVYRVVPKGGKITTGDFVFSNKRSAQEFLDKYGTKRSQTEIVSTKATPEELLLEVPKDNLYKAVQKLRPYETPRYDEFIYAPKPKTTSQLRTEYQAAKAVKDGLTEEQWMKEQGTPVFRGGDSTAIDTARGAKQGISVSTDKSIAENFTAPNGGGVGEAVLPANSKILREGQIPKDLQSAYMDEAKVLADPNNFSTELQKSVLAKQQAIIEYARKNGFDAVDFPFEDEIRIIKPNILKTSTQLRAAFREATQAKGAGNISPNSPSQSGIPESSAVTPGITAESLNVTRTLAQQRNRQFLDFIKNIGLSSEGVPVTLPMYTYAQNFGQHLLGSFAEKYGGNVRLTLKGTSTKITLPVEKLYGWLENNIDTVALLREKSLGKVLTGKGLKPRALFDLSVEDFTNLGLSKQMAKDLETIARKSRREINASVIGAGEKVVNYLRTGGDPLSRAFNAFINTANLGRYTYSPFFILQTFFETNINAALMLKNPLFLPGVGGVAKRVVAVAGPVARGLNKVGVAPERMVRWAENAKSYINDIIGKPTSAEEIAFHKVVAKNFGTEFEQTSFSTASQMERYAVRGGDKLPGESGKLPGIREVREFEAEKQRGNIMAHSIGASMQKTSTQFGKGIAKRFGMTLEEALDYDLVNGKQVFKNPEVVKLMREQLQTLLHYKDGMLASPLVKTMNVIFFPMRFQLKAMDIAANWYGSLSPASRIIVANNWIHFAQWTGTDEGKEWRRTNKNTFFRILEYSTAFAQIGTTIDAVTRGNLFGGNAGLIGGVPFGFIVEIARNLGYFPDDPEQYNPKTGEQFEKEVAVQGATLAQVTQSIEEIVGQMMPGTPLYTLTGGLLSGSVRSFVQRGLIRPLAGMGRQIWNGEDIAEGKKEIEKDFEYVPIDE